MLLDRNHNAICILVSMIVIHISPWSFASSLIEIPCSFNPVGSGARAIGMGGAFMGIADDATAASWNPAALINLKKPELSIVFTYDYLQEKNNFGIYPQASGNQPISKMSMNYLSGVYPVVLLDTNMVFAASIQRMLSLSRRWRFPFHVANEISSETSLHDYEQTGDLYALGLSWCIEIVQPKLSLGVTVNQWEDGFIGHDWEQNYHVETFVIYGGRSSIEKEYATKAYSFKGVNATIGLAWDINDQWRLGAVVKTPFNASIQEKSQRSNQNNGKPEFKNSRLEMPMTLGLGLLYSYHENFYLAADVYQTHWHHFLIQTEGQERCPLSGQSRAAFQMDRTYQVRLGGEYIWVDPIWHRLIPFRFGLFYDPMPSEKNGDDIYGFSLGTGWTYLDQFSIDIAYQFRFGNDIGEHYLPELDFSQDIRESQIYCSIILY